MLLLLPVLLLAAVASSACGDESIEVALAPVSPPPAAALQTPSPPAARTVTLAAVGDLMFARDITTLMEVHGVEYPFARVRPLLSGVDFVLGNLEGTFTDRGQPLAKEYTFRTPPTMARTLSEAGFDAVSVANNHAWDFRADGLADTLAALDAAGVGFVGAGDDQAVAEAPLILRAPSGVSVAVVAFSDVGEVQFATATSAGVARADEASVERTVRRAAALADFVVAYLHWGYEYRYEPSERQRSLAAVAVRAGASAVIGAHPHVLQPWERVEGAPVLFSLGNFVFDLEPADIDYWAGIGPFQSAAAVLTLTQGQPAEVSFRPVMIDVEENRPRPADSEEAAAIMALLEPATGARRP